MKISKSILKRLKNIVLSFGFVSTFAFGHLIACNSSQVDNAPVITVPIVHAHNVVFDNVNVSDGQWSYDNIKLTLSIDTDNMSYYANQYLKTASYTLQINYTEQGVSFYLTDFLFTYTYASEDYNVYNVETLPSSIYQSPYYALGDNSVYSINLLGFNIEQDERYNYFDFNIYGANLDTNNNFSFSINDVDIEDRLNIPYSSFDFSPSLEDTNLFSNYHLPYFTALDYTQIFNRGVSSVLLNPNEYDLYTLNQYLQYGSAEYQRGLTAGQNILSFSAFVNEIFRSPITIFKDAFNFSLPLGNGEVINVGAILTFFLSIGIALTIVQLVLKIGGK